MAGMGRLKGYLKNHLTIFLLAIWQGFSLFLIAIGYWPQWLIYFNLGIILAYILLARPFEGLLLSVVSIPFYTVLPFVRLNNLTTWRLVFIWLFVVWLAKSYFSYRKGEREKIVEFLGWDKYLGLFILMAVVLLPFSRYVVQSAKQMIFFLNIYLLYLVLVNIVKTKQQVISLVKFTALSLGLVVLIGYVQLIATLFTNMDIFWVYWADFISSLYYGQALASVLLYSNSWFSYTGGGRDLRMFSILPDSHSFALLAVFCIAYLLVLTYSFTKKSKEEDKNGHHRPLSWRQKEVNFVDDQNKILGIKINYSLWSAIRFAGLAVILSGTRAVWAGMFAPLLATIYLIRKKLVRLMAEKYFWACVLVLLFFALAPLFNQGLNLIRVNRFKENFIDRAKTIYDIEESSNAIRLQVWKSGLKFAASHPLGVGLGNYIVSLDSAARDLSYADVGNRVDERFNLPQKYVTAHNLYLNILIELGILGLIAFLLFWWKYYRKVWDFLKLYRLQNNLLTFFVIATALTFLWLLAASMFDVTFFNDRVLMYFFISLGLSGVIMRDYEQLKQ